MRDLIRYLLINRMTLPADDWTMQGFGFLRLRVSERMRLHIWDSRLREAGVSDIHDHTQWAFTSRVMCGQIVNIRFQICEPTCDRAVAYNVATLNCGIGGGMIHGSMNQVYLIAGKAELYEAGKSYSQEPDEIHRTMPADGTVTLIEQARRQTDTARVFWPIGGSWGDAIPRTATRSEVDEVGGFALSMFDADDKAWRLAA